MFKSEIGLCLLEVIRSKHVQVMLQDDDRTSYFLSAAASHPHAAMYCLFLILYAVIISDWQTCLVMPFGRHISAHLQRLEDTKQLPMP